jgi:tungstate transport system substrate-binding protein
MRRFMVFALVALTMLASACGATATPTTVPTKVPTAVPTVAVTTAAPASPAAPTAAPTTAATKAPVATNTAVPTPGPTRTMGPASSLVLATTTSTADSGLLDFILPMFEKANNCKIKVIAVGTGQAIATGARGDADVLLVHARAQEDKFVADGDGIDRRDVMYNDFVLVGPASDPAKVKGMSSTADALKAIAAAKAPFASRGDGSGTDTKEKSLWKTAAITPTGEWYSSLGQGMGETLLFSSEKGAYTLTDRATYLSMKDKLKLVVILGGDNITQNADKSLLNPYGVILVNPAKHPSVNVALSKTFEDWITSVDMQKVIGDYGKDKYGQSLFYPDSAQWKAK